MRFCTALALWSGLALGALGFRHSGKIAVDLGPDWRPQADTPASAFVDLRFAEMDKAHAGLWKALQSENIKYEAVSFDDPPPTDLSILANGRALPWDDTKRPGRVNPNRLLLALQWEKFQEVVDKGGKIKMYLKSSTGDYFDAAEKIPPCWATSNMSHCVKGGFAAAYFRIPEKSVLRVQLTVSSPGDADISHEWDIETADVGSGDVQARILFLKQNHSEYQQQWGSTADSKFVWANEDAKFVAKELTILDLDSADFSPDLETNGFDMDSSGKLQKPLDDLMFNMERTDVQQDFSVEFVTTRNQTCYIASAEDLQNLSQYWQGDHFSGGRCSRDVFSDKYQTGDFWFPELKGLPVYNFVACDVNWTVNYLNCSGEPVNFSTELPTPLKFMYQTSSTRTQNTSRAVAMHTGAFLALMAEDQREAVFDQVKGKSFDSPNEKVRLGGDASDLLEAMKTAVKLSEILVESVEKASQEWWKSKTGTDTKAACFSMNFRHTRKGMKGLPIAHIDATSVHEWFKPGGPFPATSLKFFETKLGMNVSEALTHTVVTFNEWVNAGSDPIVELPLTILDTSSLDQEDVETSWLQSGLDSMSLRWSPQQKWYYKELKRGEGYRFITSPHEGPGGTSYTGTPHSAFRFIRPENVTADRPRQSYEFRCLLLDPNWTSNVNVTGLPVEPTDDEEIVKEAAGIIMGGIMASPEAVMASLVDSEDFQED